jgi:hypothetical protein
VWPVRVACPQWTAGFVAADDPAALAMAAAARARGYAAVYNTAVTPLSRWGDLTQLDTALAADGRAADGWRTRLRIAVAFLRVIAFLHDERTCAVPTSKGALGKGVD